MALPYRRACRYAGGKDIAMRFGLLGPLQVVGDTGLVSPVPAAKQRVILAALLLSTNQVVTVDQLVEAVWGAQQPPNAAAVVRTYVMRLRRVLGEAGGRIVGHPPGYLLDIRGPQECDLADVQFLRAAAQEAVKAAQWTRASELLRTALGMWRGTPLVNVPSDALQQGELPKLEELRLQLTETRVAADLELGRSAELVSELQSLVAEYPFRERFAAQLMLAYYRCGRQADALRTYREVRDELTRELGIEPGPELQLIQDRVLACDRDLLMASPGPQQGAPHENSAWPAVGPAPALGPRQLPAATRHFTGRAAEVAELTGLVPQMPLTGGAVTVSSISGMAGVGKTALAVHVAHALADEFDDGQLFIDLHGYTRGRQPRAPGGALGYFLRALGVPPPQIPDETEERAALYRHHLAGTRTLIILDNAASEAQVRPLLPGTAGCLVLTTSRRRLKGLTDAHVLALDVLPPADAAELVRAAAGQAGVAAAGPAVAEIAELCGRLPIALRITAALLRHHPGRPAEHLAGRLRSGRQRLSTLSDGETGLDAVFEVSYQGLTRPQQHLFYQLGASPCPDTDARAAAALTGTDADTAAGLLEDLADHNLLIQRVPGRYLLHDLLRLHARKLARLDPPGQQDAAQHRLLDYYQLTAWRAEARMAPYSGLIPATAPAVEDGSDLSASDARAWLRTERANILACLGEVTREDADARVVALTQGLATLMRTDGPWAEAIAMHARAASAARRQGDEQGLAAALTSLGTVRRLTGDLPGAAQVLDDALESFRRRGDRLGEAAALTERGTVHELTGRHESAADDLVKALQAYRETGDRRGQATVLTLLGEVFRMTCKWEGARQNLQEAIELYRAWGDREGETDVLLRLAQVRVSTGDYAGAARDQEAAVAITVLAGDRRGRASALAGLGTSLRLAGQYGEAMRCLEQALELEAELGSGQGRAYALTVLGAVQHAAGDLPGAARSLTEALKLYREACAHGNEAWALNHYAAVIAATGEHAQALGYYRAALILAREVQQPDEEAIALEGIGENRIWAGEQETGTARLRQALGIFEQLAAAPDVGRIRKRLAAL